MKKRYIVVHCGAGSTLYDLRQRRTARGFEKNRVFRSAKDFINKLNEGDFEACCQRFNEAMAASMDKESWKTNSGPSPKFSDLSSGSKGYRSQ